MTAEVHSKSADCVPDVSICSNAYVLALAAGELHGLAVRRYLKNFHESEGNTVHHIQLTLDRLLHVRLLSRGEVLRLKTILTLLDKHEASSADALRVVRDVHNAMVDEEASLCAVALASIAENSVHLAIEMESAKGKVNWWHVLGADLVGAGEGALVGSLGGPGGVGLGAACGAAIA